jgi:predicted transcriptional regulator
MRRQAETLRMKRVTVALPRELDTALEIYASGTGQQKNAVFRDSLLNYLAEPQHQQELAEAMKSAEAAVTSFLK